MAITRRCLHAGKLCDIRGEMSNWEFCAQRSKRAPFMSNRRRWRRFSARSLAQTAPAAVDFGPSHQSANPAPAGLGRSLREAEAKHTRVWVVPRPAWRRAASAVETCVQKPDQLGSDLLQPPPVSGALLLQKPGDLRGVFHHGFREMLDLQIHHLLDQLHNCLGMHSIDSVRGDQAESVLARMV